MDSNWRALQIFLSPKVGVFEVSEHMVSGELRCTCTSFTARRHCRHTRWVGRRRDANDGVFPMQVTTTAKHEDAARARQSSQEFRDFVLRYGRIEVL